MMTTYTPTAEVKLMAAIMAGSFDESANVVLFAKLRVMVGEDMGEHPASPGVKRMALHVWHAARQEWLRDPS